MSSKSMLVCYSHIIYIFNYTINPDNNETTTQIKEKLKVKYFSDIDECGSNSHSLMFGL